ncbi:MAG: putative O-glycosylation ligase, exosortase A system-associated [Azonexaceae bacterium]|nr:putative O-glycosylation ligase, exosortase A system-associated [Azonexaceae bacterium]
MRDILITAIFIGLVPAILYRPYLGALAWAWVSLMAPHRFAFGFSYGLPFAMVVAITTLLVLPATSQRKPFPVNVITILLILFICWMSITTMTALNPDHDSVIYMWKQVLKMHLMLLVTLMLIRGRKQIENLIWVIVVSIGYFGTKGGIFTLLTGGNFRVWGPSDTFIEGNNELALALVALIPLMYYLVRVSENKWVKRGLWVSIIACIFSVLGSHSRGAFLAIVTMMSFFIIKSDRRAMLSLILFVVVVISAMFMPSEWYARMNTIGEYQSDESANSRLNTWATIWNMALDRPIMGAGFKVGSDILYQLYSPGPWSKSFDAHSIFFQALGEHGFPGLILFLSIGIVTWVKAGKLAKTNSEGPEAEWIPLLMRMIQVSLLGFATGGAFLGLMHYDFPYYLAGLVVLVGATVEEERKDLSKKAILNST